MKSFGKLLRQYIEKSGYTIYGIAQKSNVNRTTLQKVLSDERSASARLVKNIRPFLKLTPAESMELDAAFEILQIGEELFEQRKHIKSLLENISYILPEQPLSPKPPVIKLLESSDFLPAPGVYTGYFALQHLLRELLLWECVLPPSSFPGLRINMPANLSLFRNIFTQTIRECSQSGISICHLTNFLKSESNKNESSYNLNILANILPFLPLSDFHYQVYYYYGESPLTNSYQEAFPYYALFSGVSVLLSSDCQTAVVSHDPDLHNYLENLFSAALKKAMSFMTSYHRIEDVLPHLMEMDLEDLPFYSLEYQPCLTSYLTERMIQNYAKIDAEEGAEILQFVAMRAKQLRNLNHHISIFSKSGLFHFARTGRIADLPSNYAHPLSPQDRLFILESLYRDILSNHRLHRMINPLILPISDHLICLLHRNTGLDFSYFSQTGDHYSYLRIEEPSLLEAFEDFFRYILDSPMVNSKEETLAAIQECIEETRYIKNASSKNDETFL